MPRDGSNVYSAPAGTNGSPNTTIESAKYNAFVADIVADQNTPRPVVAGGHGATTAVGGADALIVKGADIATASTLNLDNATGTFIDLTGTTTVTAVTLTAGRTRLARSVSAFQITAGASLVVNGSTSANLTTVAGELLLFEGYSSSVVRVWLVGRVGAVVLGPASSTDNALVRWDTTTGKLVQNSGATLDDNNNLTLASTDAGAGVAPDIILYRNSASPAAADLLGRFLFRGKDSAGNDQDYAQDYAYIEDATNTAEYGRRIFQTVYNGTMRDALSLRGGQATWGNTTAINFAHYLAGNAGIHTIGGGSDNTSIRLDLNGKTNANANEYGFFKWNGLGDDAYYIYQGGTHKFQNGNVTATGNVSSGAYSSSGASAGWTTGTAAVGTQSSSKTSTASQTHYQFVNPNGLVGSITTNASATAFNTSSDERLKENFTDLDASSMIDAIRMYEFSWKADGTRGFGVKAQECFEVFPEAITVGVGEQGDEDYMPWSADYSKFVPLLLAEVKALRARVAALEAA